MATMSIRQPATMAVPSEGLEYGQKVRSFVGKIVHGLEPFIGGSSLDEKEKHFLAAKNKAIVASYLMRGSL